VLGLFSLPDGGQPFDLRRERHSLVRLVQRIQRARLVTVAAGWSAATTANERRMLLGIPLRDQNSDPERARQLSPATNSAPLATELASRLGCAVLAKRYPVDDEFPIELTTRSCRQFRVLLAHLGNGAAERGQRQGTAVVQGRELLSRHG
jgi:hypothetical protein